MAIDREPAAPGPRLFWPGALMAFTLLWRLPTLGDPPWLNDEGVYAEVGKAIFQGTVLYRQVWENKPPAIYLLYGAVHALVGPGHLLVSVRLLALVAALLAQVAVYRLARRGVGRTAALLAAALAGAGLNLPLLDGTTANAEIFVVALTGPAMLLVWHAVDGARLSPGAAAPWRPVALAGVLMGIAVLFKLVAAMDILAAMALLAAGAGRRWKAPAAVLIVGVGLPLALTAAWLAGQGLLGDALYATIGYNEGYVAAGQGMHAPLLSLSLLAIPMVLLLLGLAIMRRQARDMTGVHGRSGLFAATSLWWCALALIGALASGRSYLHYYLQALPPACLCLAVALQSGSRQPERAARLGLNAFLLIWVLAVPLASWQAVAATRSGDQPGARPYGYYGYLWQRLSGSLSETAFDDRLDARVRRNVAVADYLRANAAGRERLYVWGNAPWIYYRSRSTPATRFLSAYYRPAIPGGMEQVIASLRRSPPGYIVVIEPPLPASPALSTFVRARYRRVWSYRQAVVYHLQG